MSDRHDNPVNDDELNRFWNDLVAGHRPGDGYDLSAADVRLLSDFHLRGTRLQSGSARERARLRAKVRIETDRIGRENVMNALIANPASVAGRSANGRAAPARWTPANSGARSRQRRGTSGVARFVSVAVLLLLMFAGYRALAPFRSGDDRPSSIPAAVFSAATPDAAVPTATPFPRTGHPVIGVWQVTLEAGNPGSAVVLFSFGEGGEFTTAGSENRIHIGAWRATGERTAEFVMYLEEVIPPDFFSADYVNEGPTPGATVEIWKMTATVDETGNSIDLTGHFDHYLDGNLIFTAEDMHSTGVRMVPVETNATPTS